MEEEKKAFLLYHDGIDDILALSKESAGAVIQAIYIYANTGEIPADFTPLEDIVFRHMRQGIDRCTEKWEREREKRQTRARNAANARWKKFADEHGTTVEELQKLMDATASACLSMQEHKEPCSGMLEQIEHNACNAKNANKVNVSVPVPANVSVDVSGNVPVKGNGNKPVPVNVSAVVEKGKGKSPEETQWEEPSAPDVLPIPRLFTNSIPTENGDAPLPTDEESEEQFIANFNAEQDRLAPPGQPVKYFADLSQSEIRLLRIYNTARRQKNLPPPQKIAEMLPAEIELRGLNRKQ
nr:MAG TPA: hypothetical protein [Caudoviricetes sp.]